MRDNLECGNSSGRVIMSSGPCDRGTSTCSGINASIILSSAFFEVSEEGVCLTCSIVKANQYLQTQT